jgi:hypothetical protein
MGLVCDGGRAVKVKEWQPGLRVEIFDASAIDANPKNSYRHRTGMTTQNPPIKVDYVSRIEVAIEGGDTRYFAAARVRAI